MAGGMAGGSLTLPVVVDFGRWPVGSVVTVSTVLDDPDRPAATPRPAQPDYLTRPARPVVRDADGSTCARLVNPDRAVLARRPRTSAHDGPDLLDLLNSTPGDLHA